jgi:hypothetical protein
MGNRVTVSISTQEHEAPINIYSHWDGDEIYPIVQRALEDSDRIGDGSYLTAQLVQAIFTGLGYDGKLGFGVWSGEIAPDNWDDNPAMYVDADAGLWRIGDGDWHARTARVDDVVRMAY